MSPADTNTPPATAQASAAPAPAAASADKPDKPMTAMQKVNAWLAEKGALVKERDDLKSRLDDLEAENAMLLDQKTTAESALKAANDAKTKAEKSLIEAQAEIGKLQGEEKTVGEQTAEEIAALGFPAKDLPPASDKEAGSEAKGFAKTSAAFSKGLKN